MQRNPDGARYIVPFTCAILVGFIAATLYSQHVVVRLDDAASSIANNASPSIEVLSQARSDLVQMQLAAERAVAAVSSGAAPDRAPFQQARERLDTKLSQYQDLPFYPGERDLFGVLTRANGEFERAVVGLFDRLAAQDVSGARSMLATVLPGAAGRADSELTRLVVFNANEQRRLAGEITELRQHAARLAYSLDAIATVAALVLMGFVVRASRQLVQVIEAKKRSAEERESDLRRLNERLERIAAASIRISETITRSTDLRGVFQSIVEEARTISGADYAALGCGTDPAVPFEPWVYAGMTPDQMQKIGTGPRPVGLLGLVARGRALRLDDVGASPAFLGLPPEHPSLGAFLGVPIVRDGRSTGNLYLARGPGRPAFTEQDQRVLELLASHAGVAAENAGLYRTVAEERARLQVLSEASVRMARSLDYATTLEGVAHAAIPLFADACAVDVFEGNGAARTMRRTVACDGAPALEKLVDELGRHAMPLDERDPVSTVLRTGRPLLLSSPLARGSDALAPEGAHLALMLLPPIRSALAVPLVLGDRKMGVCSFLSKRDRYRPEDVPLAEELARRAALCIENARLYVEAQKAIAAREELLGVVSHDLRNPLSAIRLAASVLERLPPGDAGAEALQKTVVSIKRSSTRMSGMINDLLDAARLDAGHLSTRVREEDALSLLRDAQEAFQPLVEGRPSPFGSWPPPESPPPCCASTTRSSGSSPT